MTFAGVATERSALFFLSLILTYPALSIIGQYYKFAGVGKLKYYFSLLSLLTGILVMIVYDIVITFGLEVEKIWKQRFSGVTVLWVIVSIQPATP